VLVFGAGGGRDSGKRELMGEEAAAVAARIIVTTDNPCHEDPARIAAQIALGAQRAGRAQVQVVLDRREAIVRALDSASSNDASSLPAVVPKPSKYSHVAG
jgi:UDP-N-acetylmuramoyl-L-alanyl-D-glutamate--2,6-diaminopimelate ligase